jgi:hypothetical protein
VQGEFSTFRGHSMMPHRTPSFLPLTDAILQSKLTSPSLTQIPTGTAMPGDQMEDPSMPLTKKKSG